MPGQFDDLHGILDDGLHRTGGPDDGYRGLSRAPISASLDKALADTLAKPIERHGRIELTAATSGIRVEAAQRLGTSWVVGGWFGLAKGAGREGGVRLGGSW